ncbi:transposase [uncultured Hymenobacter sp.]|uniref:transposase n=1 Tax=uncultured Hymenobacter sp. TaxID=170016 RepID=UPI0035CA4F66
MALGLAAWIRSRNDYVLLQICVWGDLAETDSAKSLLPLPMAGKLNSGGLPTTRKKYTPTFKAECVRQVVAGARQTDVARAQSLSPALLDRWQRQAARASRAQQRGSGRLAPAPACRAQARSNGARYLRWFNYVG